MSDIKKIISESFLEIGESIKSGNFKKRNKIGLTIFGSEHGIDNLVDGALLAAQVDGSFDIVLIGPEISTEFENVVVSSEKEAHEKMENLLESGYLQGAVTMHYNFPIGVSTVGLAATPAYGKDLIVSTTTGTTAVERVEAMILNSVNGLIVAEALGRKNPTLGVLNLDGARNVLIALNKLKDNGFNINFGTSSRQDKGAILRGNDILTASVDVMVTDSLTGNILMKILSSFNSGGSYESTGFGYGPGIGDNYDKLILILSRASGSRVVSNSLIYANKLANADVLELSKKVYREAKKAGLDKIIKEFSFTVSKEEVKEPDKEVVTEEISGIDVLELEQSVKALWKNDIYAESGMGCTGPVVLVSHKNLEKAIEILKSLNKI